MLARRRFLRAIAAAAIAGPAGALAGCAASWPALPDQLVLGFYVSWDPASRDSLARSVGQLTHVAPEWLRLDLSEAGFVDMRTAADRSTVEPLMRSSRLPILPLLNNFVPSGPGSRQRSWNGEIVGRRVSDPQARAALVAQLRDYLLAQGWQGLVLDLEALAEEDRDGLTALVRELASTLHASGLLLGQAVQQASPAFDLERLADHADFLVPMLYDEHWAEGEPGSIAGAAWSDSQLARLFARVPSQKVVLGLGNYGYDWSAGVPARSVGFSTAVAQARQAQVSSGGREGRIALDPATLNPTYSYTASDGTVRTVWLLDAATAYNQWTLARQHRPRGAALWRLGAEDPAVWEVIGRGTIDGSAGSSATVERLQAAGEVRRSFTFDSRTGLIVGGTYAVEG